MGSDTCPVQNLLGQRRKTKVSHAFGNGSVVCPLEYLQVEERAESERYDTGSQRDARQAVLGGLKALCILGKGLRSREHGVNVCFDLGLGRGPALFIWKSKIPIYKVLTI